MEEDAAGPPGASTSWGVCGASPIADWRDDGTKDIWNRDPKTMQAASKDNGELALKQHSDNNKGHHRRPQRCAEREGCPWWGKERAPLCTQNFEFKAPIGANFTVGIFAQKKGRVQNLPWPTGAKSDFKNGLAQKGDVCHDQMQINHGSGWG